MAGGLEKMVAGLANQLASRSHRVSLLIVGNSKESFYTLDRRIEIFHVNLNFGIGGAGRYIARKLKFLRDMQAFGKAVRKIHPDGIITTEYHLTAAGVYHGLQKKFKMIAWQHSSYFQKKSMLWKKLWDRAMNRVHAIVCLNHKEASYYGRYAAQKFVVPNFISVPNTRAGLTQKRILTIARLTGNKGIDLLMKTAALVLHHHQDWQWLLIGKGPYGQELDAFIVEEGLSNRLVHVAPYSENLQEQYLSASIYVMTSRVEPFGLVLIEAMSHGIPCIAFDGATGPAAIIAHRKDGILVEKESPEELAREIILLINDAAWRHTLGDAAYEKSKNYAADLVMKKWEQMILELFEARK